MNRHALFFALAISLGLASPLAATAAGKKVDSPVAALDSVPGSPSVLLSARLAYQNAWAQRQSGAYEEAARIAGGAIEQVSTALTTAPDQSMRGDLTELQSRLTGLRDVALHDRAAELAAAQSGNEADAKVLNAPAADEIEPQVNAQVLRYIEFFTGNGRSTFERWLKRSGRYMELFRSALQREGLPPDLVHLVFVESGFNLNARSVSAAVGPWQFLRSTGQLFGLTVNQWVDERRDPEKSTVAAARYLKHLYSIFGDWPLALASYNAGEGTVLRAIKKQGTTNYWDLRLPRQTEDYVPQFMAILAISRDPEKYGFDDVALDEPMAFDEVALKGAVDLRAVARMADCSYDELKLLNSAVLNHVANGSNGVTMIRVPRGKGEALLQKLQSGARLPAVDVSVRHRVRRGETLNSIASEYHVSAPQLALANGIGRKRPLRRGTTLVVPASIGAPAIAQLEDGDPRASTSYVPSRRIAPPRQIQGKSDAEGRALHTVHRGETLAGIAGQYGVTTGELRSWNRLTSDHVKRGTRLKVRIGDTAGSPTPTSTEPKPAAPRSGVPIAATASTRSTISPVNDDTVKPVPVAASVKRSSASHKRSAKHAAPKSSTRVITVKSGVTLSELADRHNMSVKALMKLNGLRNSQIRSGQKLRVPTS